MASVRSVLIIGGSGFVGSHLALRLREGYKVFATHHTHQISIKGVTVLPMNVDSRGWVRKVVDVSKPDFVIYAAGDALGSPKSRDLGELEKIHSKGAATLLNCVEMLQPKFIYLSSCKVFDGNRGNYREGEAALPTTLIGKAKVAGENFIRSRSLSSLIIRCSPLFGRGNGLNMSYLDGVRMQFDRGKTVHFPANEVHSFTPVESLAELILELISKPLVRNKMIHFGGLTKMSYLSFGQAFARRFGYDPRLAVRAVPQRELLAAALQVNDHENTIRDYSLNSTQAVELLKIKPLLLQEGFDLIEKKLISSS